MRKTIGEFTNLKMSERSYSRECNICFRRFVTYGSNPTGSLLLIRCPDCKHGVFCVEIFCSSCRTYTLCRDVKKPVDLLVCAHCSRTYPNPYRSRILNKENFLWDIIKKLCLGKPEDTFWAKQLNCTICGVDSVWIKLRNKEPAKYCVLCNEYL